MAIEYNKTNWVNNVTKLNATNMNHIEDGIKNASDELNTKASVDYVDKTYYGYSGDDLLIIPEGTTAIAEGDYPNTYKCVVIPNTVTSIGEKAFYKWSKLEKIIIPDSVTRIDSDAFFVCSSLTSITIPNSVTSIDSYAFAYCSSLTNITIPDSVTSISKYAFIGCPLEIIDLTAYTTQSFPTLETGNFTAIASDCQIKVIKGRKAKLIATQGWSNYASYVVEVPTVETLDAALEQDYYKIDKSQTTSTIPYWDGTKAGTLKAASDNVENSVAQRDYRGDCNFHKINFEFIGFKDDTSPSVMYYYDLYNNTLGSDYLIEKTPTNTGTLTTTQLTELQNVRQSKNLRIVYDNQVYYRINQQGLLNLKYIHLDVENNKATGKIFNVISTGDWQVFDLDFGGSTRTTHNLTLTNSSTGMSIYFSLTNNRPETYEGAPAGLLAALENSTIACTVNLGGVYSAGMITTEGDNFKVFYGNSEEMTITQTEMAITDNIV